MDDPGGAVSPTPHIKGETRETHPETTTSLPPVRGGVSQLASLLRIAKMGRATGEGALCTAGRQSPHAPFAFPWQNPPRLQPCLQRHRLSPVLPRVWHTFFMCSTLRGPGPGPVLPYPVRMILIPVLTDAGAGTGAGACTRPPYPSNQRRSDAAAMGRPMGGSARPMGGRCWGSAGAVGLPYPNPM